MFQRLSYLTFLAISIIRNSREFVYNIFCPPLPWELVFTFVMKMQQYSDLQNCKLIKKNCCSMFLCFLAKNYLIVGSRHLPCILYLIVPRLSVASCRPSLACCPGMWYLSWGGWCEMKTDCPPRCGANPPAAPLSPARRGTVYSVTRRPPAPSPRTLPVVTVRHCRPAAAGRWGESAAAGIFC